MTEADREDTIVEIERLLVRIETDQRHRATVADIRKLLKRIGSAARRPTRRRTGEDTKYALEGEGEQASLAEYRQSGQPLRVGKPAYDLLVNTLAAAGRPLAFDEVMTAMANASSDPPADWQARVILRYLLRAKPDLVRRARSRYQPLNPPGLRKAAERWWKAARRGS